MGRLTKRSANGGWCLDGAYCYSVYADYENPSPFAGVGIDKLAEYEDAEEQGLIVHYPCKIGDTVYVITESQRHSDGAVSNCVVAGTIDMLTFTGNIGFSLSPQYVAGYGIEWDDFYRVEEVYFTRSEADSALSARKKLT